MPEEEGWWREHSRRGTDCIVNIAKEIGDLIKEYIRIYNMYRNTLPSITLAQLVRLSFL